MHSLGGVLAAPIGPCGKICEVIGLVGQNRASVGNVHVVGCGIRPARYVTKLETVLSRWSNEHIAPAAQQQQGVHSDFRCASAL